jgi:hypothetical protein
MKSAPPTAEEGPAFSPSSAILINADLQSHREKVTVSHLMELAVASRSCTKLMRAPSGIVPDSTLTRMVLLRK